MVKHFAPAGVYYVLEDVSIRRPAGILGVPAGTKVRMVADNGENMTVSDGKDTFDVSKALLGNEVEAGTDLMRRSQQEDAQNQRFRQQMDDAQRKIDQDNLRFLSEHPLEHAAPSASPGARH